MTHFLKFNLALIISLNFFLTTDIVGSSSLNPYAEPYAPKTADRNLAMVRTIRNGLISYVSKKSLLIIENTSTQAISSYASQALTLYFWAAIYNSYHKAAYKIAEILFKKNIPDKLRKFPNLSKCTDAEMISALSSFYSLMEKINCEDFSPEDHACIATHIAKFRPPQ